MGDAAGDGEVRSMDPDRTIDGIEPHRDAAPPTRAPITARDFEQLSAVERDRYAIQGEIATGGMGRVLEARDLRLGRQVAIKELLPRFRDAARRFEREARITARLQHPAIIHIYEAGVWPGGEPFYAMPKVEGRSLDKVVAEKRTLNERLGLLPNVIAVADALAYAHNENVIHRDLKPANVLVGEFGETVVIDWGLAKDLGETGPPIDPRESLMLRLRVASSEETASGSIVGTPAYMPAEQARGEPVDQRADVYALGALLYKVLTGKAPYEGARSQDVIEQVKLRPPVAVHEREPGTPPDLAAIVGKAMAREPADRYASAGELAQDLKRFQTGQLVAAYHYTMSQLVVRWLRRHRVAVGISAVALATLAAVAAISIRRIAADETNARALRTAVLEERGRIELLAGHAAAALANLVGALDDGRIGGNRGFLIADAKRRFATEFAHHAVGDGDVVVAVSPDGKHVAAGGTQLIEYTADGAHERTLETTGRVGVLAFSPDGALLLAGTDAGVVRLWRASGAARELARRPGAIGDAAFSADGTRVVIASGDTASVVDASTGRSVESRCDKAGAVRSARFDHDGTWVVTTSDDGKPCVWDAKTGDVVTNLRGPGQPAAADWSGDGELVITGGSDGAARIWSAEAGKLVVQPLRHDQGTAIKVVRLSPDGRFVLTGGTDHVARIWALPRAPLREGALGAAKLVARLDGHTSAIATAAFSADGTLVATGGYDGLAKVWDRTTGHELATFEHGDAVTSLAFLADGGRLATGSRDGIARLWTVPAPPDRPPAVGSAVHAIAVAAGTIAIGTDDSVVRLYRDHTMLRLEGHKGRVFALAFAADGSRLVSAGEDRELLVWDVTHRAPRARAIALPDDGDAIVDVAIAPDDRVAAASGGVVHVWTLATGALVATHEYPHAITAVTFDASGELVAGADDGSVVTWPAGGAAAHHKVLNGPINALALSPRGDAFVVGGQNDAAILRTDMTVANRLDGITDDVRAIAFTANGERVITASSDGIARIWDARGGKLLGVRGSRGPAASSLAVDGDTLWVGNEDDAGTVAAWDIAVATDTQDALEAFVRDRHVAVRLRDDVAVKE